VKRRLFNLLAAVSLVLCAASAALWVRSYFVLDALWYEPISCDFEYSVCSTCGRVIIIKYTPLGYLFPRTSARFAYETRQPTAVAQPRYVEFALCGMILGDDFSNTGSYPCHVDCLIIPHWILLAGSATSATLMFWASNGRRRAYRLAHNLCIRCGYDLRASIARCPECGTAIWAEIPVGAPSAESKAKQEM
jgi:predicted RNA-binding Zn-ribbon protein involved in translation (DUF1610 family)